jgi:cytochrome P450
MGTPTVAWTNPPANEADLFAWFREMRAHDPVQRDPKGEWHVFGYPEAVQVLGDHANFSNVIAEVPGGSSIKLFGSGNLAWMDQPRHRQLRSLVNRVFTPRYVAGLEPAIASTAGAMLEKVRRADVVKFVDDYAFPVMLTVIAEMVGVPREDYPLFGKWLKVLLAITEPAGENLLEPFALLTREMDRTLHEQIARRRVEPADDLISRLIAADVDGERLDDDEIAGLVALLVATGEGGATQTLSNALICLDREPAVTARLRAEPHLVDGAIEEVMRHRSQTTRVARRTVRDTVVGGHLIPEGAGLSVWLIAANRDERKFADPDRFVPDRSPNQHISLGSGIHFCLGAPLARLEVRLVLAQFLRATRGFSVDYANSRLLDPRMICGVRELVLRVDWR